jgi:uncharacterized membrane protein
MATGKATDRIREHRWPAATALLVALALYATLPSVFPAPLRVAVVVIGLGLLIPLLIANPVRFERQTRLTRAASVTQSLVLLVANQVAIVVLIVSLVTASTGSASHVLLGSLQVWATNVIAVALVLWELDRGGPVDRSVLDRPQLPAADLRFSQDEDHDASDEVAAGASKVTDWRPTFIDYLYTSLSNSMAFSASDSMPLSPRAKILMGLQAFSGFVILALVIARAVSLLG